MLHVKYNFRFEQRGGERQNVGLTDPWNASFERKANKSHNLDCDPGCVCLCIVVGKMRSQSVAVKF